jgi:hypothetical protein
MKLEHSGMQSDISRSIRKEDRNSSMATEGHRSTERKKPELMSAAEMDKELYGLKADI